jgi:hypothetical protein
MKKIVLTTFLLRQILDELNKEKEESLKLLLENSEKRNKKGKNSK